MLTRSEGRGAGNSNKLLLAIDAYLWYTDDTNKTGGTAMASQNKQPSSPLAEYRRARGLSQNELAQKLHVTRQAVSRWETGKTSPGPDVLCQLTGILGVSTDTLLGTEHPDPIDGKAVYRSYTVLKSQTPKEKRTMNEPKRKLRIGVFGGHRGDTMIHVLLHHPDAELVAVCDKYVPLLEKAKKTAEECGVEIALYERFDDFIEHDMDAVVLANYANEHSIFGMRCMRAGKHVLSEVLPCETMAQAVALIECVEETGMVYAYAENYCYMQHTFEMWRRYKDGEFGDVMYGEGEYIHDCSSIWPQITYGERDHWRNILFPTFYCTHSLGPLITITGLRPVRVVGFEMNHPEEMRSLGAWGGSAGMEIVTLENGAVMKSVHGGLKREPGSVNYELYCTKGMMETGRLSPLEPFNAYKESDRRCVGTWEHYSPEPKIAAEAAKNFPGHGGSDFFATHFFIEKILGRPDGKWAIDVYTAVDMGICGILAYQSILAGNKPMDVPNLRNKEERDAWRNNNITCNPAVAGDQVVPASSYPGAGPAPDEAYDKVRELWEKGENA